MSAGSVAGPVAHRPVSIRDDAPRALTGGHGAGTAGGAALLPFRGPGPGERGPGVAVMVLGAAGGAQDREGRRDEGATAYQLYLELI